MHPLFGSTFAAPMRAALLIGLGCCAFPGSASTPDVSAAPPPATWHLTARIVAVGLPGVAGVRQVGRFHAGGPFAGNPEFLLQTDRGRVLDPRRVMVAVGGNFGAPPADGRVAPGTILSIDPEQDRPLVVDPRFAAAGGQATTAGGAVQVYTAQSPAFVNARHSAGARTAAYTAAAGPRYLSINNAFGRPWIANAPRGVRGEGSLSVVDPDGAPLANAPSDDAGGVFVGSLTNRRQVTKRYASTLLARAFNYRDSPQLTDGSLAHAALGTAFLGASPDGTGLAVFATVTADGAIAQVHVQDGVDGLAPAGSVRPANDDGGVVGIAFQWNPGRALYVADAGRDEILVLGLVDDRRQFRVGGTRRIASPWLATPVDLAAALPEIGNPAFASHTTLSGGSDLYVANRGDGSLLRIAQDGTPLARATIAFADGSTLGRDRLRALAVSSDASRIWVTVQGSVPGFPGHDGALLELTAFDAAGVYAASRSAAVPAAVDARTGDRAIVAAGERAFAQAFTPQTGLGSLFNAQSCVACHPGPGGASPLDAHVVRRVARMDVVTGRVTAIDHPNSPVARRRSTRELGQADAPSAAVPRDANLTALRIPIALFDVGAIDDVADAAIEAEAVSKGDGIKGRVHYVAGAAGDLRIGRFGWKADVASLDAMVADAFASELGLTSALAVRPSAAARDDGGLVRAVSAYLRSLAAPAVAVVASSPATAARPTMPIAASARTAPTPPPAPTTATAAIAAMTPANLSAPTGASAPTNASAPTPATDAIKNTDRTNATNGTKAATTTHTSAAAPPTPTSDITPSSATRTTNHLKTTRATNPTDARKAADATNATNATDATSATSATNATNPAESAAPLAPLTSTIRAAASRRGGSTASATATALGTTTATVIAPTPVTVPNAAAAPPTPTVSLTATGTTPLIAAGASTSTRPAVPPPSSTSTAPAAPSTSSTPTAAVATVHAR